MTAEEGESWGWRNFISASLANLAVSQMPTNEREQTHLLPPHLPCSCLCHFPPCSSPTGPPTSLSLWCKGTACQACGRSTKPRLGFGAWFLSVERRPGPLRAEGWELRVEGRWGGEGRAVGREEREESGGSEQYSSGSPSKSFSPNGETGFLCGERERKGGKA